MIGHKPLPPPHTGIHKDCIFPIYHSSLSSQLITMFITVSLFEGYGSGFKTGCPFRSCGVNRLGAALPWLFISMVLRSNPHCTYHQAPLLKKNSFYIALSFSELEVFLVKCCDNVMISGRLFL